LTDFTANKNAIILVLLRGTKKIPLFVIARNEEDSIVCHCEERSDEAISYYKNVEIAALPSVARNDKLYQIAALCWQRRIAALPSVARNDI